MEEEAPARLRENGVRSMPRKHAGKGRKTRKGAVCPTCGRAGLKRPIVFLDTTRTACANSGGIWTFSTPLVVKKKPGRSRTSP